MEMGEFMDLVQILLKYNQISNLHILLSIDLVLVEMMQDIRLPLVAQKKRMQVA